MSTETEADYGRGLEAYASTAPRHFPIVITVTPDTRPGRYRAYVEAKQEPLFTVNERSETFAKWKRSRQSSRNLPNKYLEDPAAEKTSPRSTAEKHQRLATLTEQVGRGYPMYDELRPEPEVRAINSAA
jgi:hypothetical protein